jgi:exopolysaccharide biosynthesis polyprenyl glycosylphosphotransferase
MFRRFSVDFAVLSIFLDGCLIAFALWIAKEIRPFLSQFSFAREIPYPIVIPLWLFILFASLWVVILMVFAVYDGRKNVRWGDLWMRLTSGSLLAMVAQAGVLYLTLRDISRLLFITFILIAYAALLFSRLLLFAFVQRKWFPSAARRMVLIAGAGLVGKQVQEQIDRFASLGLTLAGFLDDDPQKRSQDGSILGSLDDVRNIVTERAVTDVIVALPTKAYDRMNMLVAELHDLPVKVWVIPDYFSLALHQASVEEFAGLPMIDLRAPALTEYQRMIKRVFDVVVSVVLLPILLVFMAVIALAIRLDSPGPAIFRQKRVGENGRLFEMVKFRTMVQNAESLRHLVEQIDEDGNLRHKTANDPRVTRVGKFLRKSSLDELPNIYNVLRGEMSLVGPRPELPYLVEKYQTWQRKRFAVPQGITGWWQVNGRSDKPMHLHTEDDIYYVQHYSIWLDIVILLKTAQAVFTQKGAF